jgi:hypothetical protein
MRIALMLQVYNTNYVRCTGYLKKSYTKAFQTVVTVWQVLQKRLHLKRPVTVGISL